MHPADLKVKHVQKFVYSRRQERDDGSLVLTSFFFQAEDGIRDLTVTGVQTCALPISYLPTDNGGSLLYANRGAYYASAGNELWTALAEKAYVQINEMGWTRGSLSGSGDRKSVV